MDAYVTVKGQIVIPAKIRRMFGIKDGTRVRVEADEDRRRIILTPVTREFIQNLRGKYKGKRMLAALAAEKQRSRNTAIPSSSRATRNSSRSREKSVFAGCRSRVIE